MTAYYNEIDAYAAGWLRNLISAGLIPAGDIDERSIVDVSAGDLDGYTQCHFFAGIGGWSYALRLAGWSDDEPVWTGSCPCQPLSSAGQRKGHADERHLWPAFYDLIAECRPATVFGEQVASVLGREWLAGVRADLEAAGYAIGAADLCAAGVGAPHIRQRLFWVADSQYAERRAFGFAQQDVINRDDGGRSQAHGQPGACGEVRGVGDATNNGCREECSISGGRSAGDHSQGSAKRPRIGYWSAAEWLQCLDGKSRRIEPGICPLAHGVSGRMVVRRAPQQGDPEAEAEHWYSRAGALHGLGNTIVPQVAARFVSAFRAASR